MKNENSIEQYLELYRENEPLFGKYFPEGWSRIRSRALGYLSSGHLPERGEEGYEKTSLNDLFAPDYGVNIGNLDLIGPRLKQGCGIETLKSIRITVLNDIPAKIELPRGLESLPQGLVIKNFAELTNDEMEEIAGAIGNMMEGDRNVAAEALNVLLGINGIYIRLEKDSTVDIPVQIINYCGSTMPLLSNRKVFINVGERAKLNVLSCDHSVNNAEQPSCLNNVLTFIKTGSRSTLNYVEMEETTGSTNRYGSFNATIGEEAQINIGTLTLYNGNSRNNYNISLTGERATLSINGLVIGKNVSMSDNYTNVIHRSDIGKSNQLFKYALFDESQGVFQGEIVVDKEARFNEAYQNNKNILLSEAARMYAKPRLLIYNDDVKCGHGATTGQLDAAAVYYMQTRGIPREEARAMLLQAFMNDVVDRIEFPGLNDRLLHLVERRLKGEDVLCGSCKLKD